MPKIDPMNVPLEPFRPAEVSSISQCGSIQYGYARTYRHDEMRLGSGQLVQQYETPTAIMARLEYEEGWTPVTVTWDADHTWCTIYLRRDLSVLPRRVVHTQAEEERARREG